MKKIFVLFIILLILIPSVTAENVNIKGIDFEIPHQYEHGTKKDTSYVYESGFKFRILNLDDSKNLRFNFGSDVSESKSVEQTTIAGHDAVVVSGEYNSKPHTTVYFVTGKQIFLICFNDTYVNNDIAGIIEKTPSQTMSHDEFSNSLNKALDDYQKQVEQENRDYDSYQSSKNNKASTRYYFFSF